MSAPASRPLSAVATVVGAGLLLIGCADEPTTPSSAPTQASSSEAPAASAAAGLTYQQVASGGIHTCALTADGRAWCWGEHGLIGDGTDQPRLRPTAVAGGLVFRSISAGDLHTCAVTTDDRIFCWGDNGLGQLGDGTTTSRRSPKAVAGTRRWATVTAGGRHTCAISKIDRRAYCWGFNNVGQLGTGGTANRKIPTPVAGGLTWLQLDVGLFHSCGLTRANVAYCWGMDSHGTLGDGSTRENRLVPTVVAGGLAFTRIDAGYERTCALTGAGQAWCWGTSPVGDRSELDRYTPRATFGRITFRQITTGDVRCGAAPSGKAYCWGFDAFGALGNGLINPNIEPVPFAVQTDVAFTQLSAGASHVCGRAVDGALYCWGQNTEGRLGDGTTENRQVPTRVAEPES